MPRLVSSIALAALLLTSCVHERTRPVGTFPEGLLARGGDLFDREPSPKSAPYAAEQALRSVPSVAQPGDDHKISDRKVSVSDAPAAHRPIPAGESLEDRARTKFLASSTEVSADRVTLYVPRAFAGEVSLRGTNVADDGPGRRTATGGAVATLRRLTIRATQLIVVVRDDNLDVQLSARGDVSLRSDQPASIIEESALRSLLLKNDGYTPLR